MKTFLVISQTFYLLCLIPWLIMFGFSFMSFDSGVHFFNVAFVVGIALYPIAVVFCSIFAWFLQERSKHVAIIINLVPMVWIVGLGLPMFVLN